MFFFLYFLMDFMVLEEYRLAFLKALLLSFKFYFRSFLNGFYINFHLSFFIICKYFYTKDGVL